MKQSERHDRVSDLVTVLDRLEAMHRELHGVIRDKIERMRASDIGGMREATEREGEWIRRITEQEGLRRQLMDLIAEELGLTVGPADAAGAAPGTRWGGSRWPLPEASRGRAMTVRGLADHLGDSRAAALLEGAGRLRATVARVAEGNRVAGLIAREILGHLRHIFAAMTGADRRRGRYSDRGYVVIGADEALFDTVG